MTFFKIKFVAMVFLIAVCATVGVVRAQPSCISFESPLAGSVYSTPSCTVSLKVDCPNVMRVDLQARYLPEGSDSAIIVSLGTISRPPFKLIWNTSNLPNQLFTGISIAAEVSISGSLPQVTRQEGIFLTHNPIERKTITVPYVPAGVDGDNAFAQKINTGNPQITASSIVTWNEKALTFSVSVQDPSFYISQPGRDIAEAGLEILIDPTRSRAPHPTDSTLFFVVPLRGTPYRIDYTAEINDGVFRLVPKSARVNYTHNVGLAEFRGYNVNISIPREVFGKSIPDTFGCNLVLRVLDDAGHVQKVSLVGSHTNDIYSPFTWPDYQRLPKPLLMNAALQFVMFPTIGFLLALAAYLIITKMRKPQLLSNFERSEEEKRAFNQVNTIVEQDLVKKDLTIDHVAKKCNMDPKALNSLVKRNTGFSFVNYLQFCRTEVAKERLRSSRSSEKSIADLCGFSSAMEMEKCFSKFHHITPYKFRSQQQVS